MIGAAMPMAISPGKPRPRVDVGTLTRQLEGAVARGDARTELTGVVHDSRRVAPGDLFVARPGLSTDGAAFVVQAIERGAAAVLSGRGVLGSLAVPSIEVDDVPRALAFAAHEVYGRPLDRLRVTGITGTNGKTTTALILQRLLEVCDRTPGVVGTLGFAVGSERRPSPHTSPEADELNRAALWMLERGATDLVMEVSSIALQAQRVAAVPFAAAGFTNLTQDHLDYHGTMEAYEQAKLRLFTELAPAVAVVNVATPVGRRIVSGASSARTIRYAATREHGAELFSTRVERSPLGQTVDIDGVFGRASFELPLVGDHNVENLLCALGLVGAMGHAIADLEHAFAQGFAVPGRLERCDDPAHGGPLVMVDYAHTPGALDSVLRTLRQATRGRLLCVFGCGGDRDADKRPQMGRVVGEQADVAIITNDNPRSEEPQAIADAVLAGMTQSRAEALVVLDRERAIHRAVADAASDDVVLIAGKGHETYQIVGNRTLDFDDREVAKAALALRFGGAS